MTTKEEATRLAKEVGAVFDVLCHGRHDNVVFTSGEFERFYTLAQNEAYKQAAEVCDVARGLYEQSNHFDHADGSIRCRDAILALVKERK